LSRFLLLVGGEIGGENDYFLLIPHHLSGVQRLLEAEQQAAFNAF
jgi:hypothetical protein